MFLAIYIFDLMIFKNFINKQNVSIVFICANHLASKYLETFYFPISDFINRVQSPVEKEHVIVMEERILSQMNFNLGLSNPFDYLQRITMICKPSQEDYILMHQFVEISFFDSNIMAFSPQEIAIASYRYWCEVKKTFFVNKKLKKYFEWTEHNVRAIRDFIAF